MTPLMQSIAISGIGSEPAGRGWEPVGRGWEPAGRDSESVGRDYQSAGRGWDSAGRGWEPTWRALELAGRVSKPVGWASDQELKGLGPRKEKKWTVPLYAGHRPLWGCCRKIGYGRTNIRMEVHTALYRDARKHLEINSWVVIAHSSSFRKT